MQFADIFLRIAEQGLARQDQKTGAMPPGHNGPYLDPETPVRNTAHWIQTYLAADRMAGDRKFLEAARACADYLVGPVVPKTGAVYQHRSKEGKDSCNGLIGPAWTIEGLCAGYDAFGDRRYLDAATQYFLAHPFSPSTKRWSRVEPDGEILTEDMTFNHQLWFCMAGALLWKSDLSEAIATVNVFMDDIGDNLSIASNGRIAHSIVTGRSSIKRQVKRILKPGFRKAELQREVGYHAFNLYAFAVLRTLLPGKAFWSSGPMKLACAYQGNHEFVSLIDHSPYGFAYNPPGFEIPFINDVFSWPDISESSDEQWLSRQLDRVLDPGTAMLSRNNPDSETLTARIYECARFPERLFALPVESLSR